MIQGTVKWFNITKGYGFIKTTEPEGDFFFHYSEIQMEGFKKLETGDRVEFESKEKTEKGWLATRIRRIGSNFEPQTQS